MRIVLLLALLCGAASWCPAQSISTIGVPATLDVGAWNIKQFQNSDPQMANVVRVLQESGVDIWSLEEVTSDGVLTALLGRLGSDWDGNISSSSNLRTAFVYRKDAIRVRRVSTILSEFDYEFAGRPPLMLEADVTLPDSTIQIRFISLHMKCCSDGTSYDRRKASADALKNRLDFLYPSDRVVVMGDFNDETGNSITFGRPSPFAGFVTSPDYEFLIEDLSIGTFCFSDPNCRTGSTIDNILISDELFGNYLTGSGDRFEALLSELDRYVFTTSDHLPVTARFGFVDATATEPVFSVTPVQAWPIPASHSLQVDAAPGDQLVLVDLLGREMLRTQSSGGGRIVMDISDLAPGLYLLSINRSGALQHLFVPVAR